MQDAFFGLYRRWATLKDPDSALIYVRSALPAPAAINPQEGFPLSCIAW